MFLITLKRGEQIFSDKIIARELNNNKIIETINRLLLNFTIKGETTIEMGY